MKKSSLANGNDDDDDDDDGVSETRDARLLSFTPSSLPLTKLPLMLRLIEVKYR